MTMRPDPTFHASPKLAMEAPPENFAYTLLLSPDFSKPDALAVVDVKPGSPTFSQVVHTVTMPTRATSFTISAGTPARRHCRRSPATRSSSGAT
jgi:selenium-binding protein 1